MQAVRIACLCGLQCCLVSSFVWGQTDSLPAEESSWWKQLFRPKTVEQSQAPAEAPDVVAAPEPVAPEPAVLDTLGVVEPPSFRPIEPATWRLEADARLLALDSAWHDAPPAMAGYRIQLMTGPLNRCRQERYHLRGSTELGIYLEPHSANYQVLIGDFRDPWSAERERAAWAAQFPDALVVPSSIALPRLDRLETTIAEPVEGSGDWD